MRIAARGSLRRNLARSAAVLLVGGLASGCSSDVMRFQDSILTGSSRNAPQAAPVAQAYPGDASGLDQTYTGSVSRAAVRPAGIFQRSGLIPRPEGHVGVTSVAPAPVNPYPAAAQPTTYRTASYDTRPAYGAPAASGGGVQRASLDNTVTGSTRLVDVAPRAVPVQPMPQATGTIAAAAVEGGRGGWTRTGGSQVTVRQGETVYNMSKRFGVPVDAILKANGMESASALTAGQQVVIPTYVHSNRAPVSAPDSNPNVASASSSRGDSSPRTPPSAPAPQQRVAVLPQQPKLKEGQVGAQTASADTRHGSAASGGTYTVVAGDTLNAIARRNGTTTAAIKQANGLDGGMIRIGQKLVIPGSSASSARVASAPATDPTKTASVPPAGKPAGYTPPARSGSIQQAALESTAPAPDSTGIGKMRWPVRGRVIGQYGSSSNGKKNDGIDIAVPSGTPVKAAENGVVIYAGDGLKEFGNTVLVRHEDGLVTVYGHASQIKVQRGQKVRRGEDIALAGTSGNAETPKLHFEVRKDSAPVNPGKYLE